MYGIYIEKHSPLSVTRQICHQLRLMIESGQLTAGTRLLPTRVLAKEWGIARNVVIEVYEQLTAEGYLEGRVGSGTYVAEGITPAFRALASHNSKDVSENTGADYPNPDIIDFATGIPDLALFPRTLWGKYMKEAAETVTDQDPGYGDILGDLKLRSAIRDFVHRTKGIRCSTEQVVIVSGASEGIFLTAFSLSSKFHSIYLEDPTIELTRDIFQMMNYEIVPVEVDRNGMNIDSLPQFAPGHLMLLTPSHQFPSGSLLSIQRRQRAIRLAEEADTFLIEDDYDSEFRLKGIPVPALQTLSPTRVIYVGTFSKTLSPSLRIGFLIVPPNLVDTIVTMKDKLHLYTPLLIQKALSRFMQEGHLDRHIHTMKKVYKKRREVLKDRLHHTFGKEISILGDEAGMHLLVHFHSRSHALLPWKHTSTYGFRIERSDDYKIGDRPNRAEIVLGYGNLTAEKIEEGVRRMHKFVSSNQVTSSSQ
ncbi:PLP-dependent aminotransferase family protein [Paenibacillus sp. MBLB4367]|uniref:MocR-like pyridoxine biosynthesis transcription factor PdxR n=1 Tax=Paenibacillus sp. MBLB4367 TaxID=3384767 RepID=UPI003908285E